jgi:anti-sigma factor RsiW
MTTHTHEERQKLIQRYFDGETLGNEARLAEELIDADPALAAELESLKVISGAVRTELAAVVAQEDFTSYWDDIEKKLPKGPLTLNAEEGTRQGKGAMVRTTAPATEPSMLWLRRILVGPVLAAGGLALAVLAFGIGDRATSPGGGPGLARVDQTLEVESVESEGEMVMVVQDDTSVPAIVWFTEGQEG